MASRSGYSILLIARILSYTSGRIKQQIQADLTGKMLIGVNLTPNRLSARN
ncbi:hypothetical protein [Nostoc sp.]|uniref:hypothetical protein n=1 Tax=Nostoc sp. TaxID=1180 RepID=UPI002FF4FC80